MANKVPTIEVADRNTSMNPRALRRSGRIPATVYGRNLDSFSVDLDKRFFTNLYNSQLLSLVSLNKDGSPFNAIVKKVHVDPLSLEIENIEFVKVRDDQKVKITLPLFFVNESQAVKDGGILLQLLNEVEVECFPKYMPDRINVDLSKLEEVGTSLNVAQLEYTEGVEPVTLADTAVVSVSAPKASSEAADSESGESASVESTPVASEV